MLTMNSCQKQLDDFAAYLAGEPSEKSKVEDCGFCLMCEICQRSQRELQYKRYIEQEVEVLILKLGNLNDQTREDSMRGEPQLDRDNFSSYTSSLNEIQFSESSYDNEEDSRQQKRRKRKVKKMKENKRKSNKNSHDQNIRCLQRLLIKQKENFNLADERIFEKNRKGRNFIYDLIENKRLSQIFAQIFCDGKVNREMQFGNAKIQNKIASIREMRKLNKYFIKYHLKLLQSQQKEIFKY